MKVWAVGLVLMAAIACSRGPLTVDTIQLGRSLNPDSSVASHTTTFTRNETVYVSVPDDRHRRRHDRRQVELCRPRHRRAQEGSLL